MSRELPLWEDDESDVKLEYRLQYGHVFVGTPDVSRLLRKIRTVFKLGTPKVTASVIDSKILPCERGITLLGNDDDWHLILAKFGKNIAVFGPHRFFLGSYRWTIVSKKLKVSLASIFSEINVFYYTVFQSGKHVCNVYLDSKGFHEALVGPVDVYFNGKPIYKHRDFEGKLAEEIKEFISEDIVIYIDEKKMLRFKKPLSDGFNEPDEVCHAVFNAKIQEDNKRHNDICNIRNPIDILIEKVGGLFVK